MKQSVFILGFIFMLCCGFKLSASEPFSEPPRLPGQKSVLGLAVDPIPVVRVGFIGLGRQGSSAVRYMCRMDGVEVKAVCDMEQRNIDAIKEFLEENGREEAEIYFGDENSWRGLCEQDDIDLVVISTDWLSHAPMAVYAMEQGKHVAIEVPGVMTVEDCWKLVNTAELTQKHCYMRSNCNYDMFALGTLNMAQQGLFGEVKHVEGAYIDDLRTLIFREREQNGFYNYWRREYNAEHDGSLYPTHGLAPLCHVLDIHRGDKMDYLVSMSSPQYGMTDWATDLHGEDSPEALREYKKGDINTTLIKTHKGKTMMIQHDVASPRPYDRIHLISGTKGFAKKYPQPQLSFAPNARRPLKDEEMGELLEQYEFPFVKEQKENAQKLSRYNEMEYFMNYRLIYCLQNGLPLDIDVYDVAEWSSIIELSEYSVENGSIPVRIPDFTRGDWDKVKGYRHAYKK